MTTTHRIAVIAGDGIGTEVMPEGLRVLRAAAARFDIALEFEEFDFASAAYWQKHGQMLPDDWFETLRGFDAIFFGAVGWPDVVPDHVSLWGSLIQFRRAFDQYVNLRPVRLMPGVVSPLAGREPGDIDFYVVRENTEGEYSSIGGRMFEGTDREFVLQETVMTRTGVDRVLRYAYDLAQKRDAKHLTSATKSNGISISMPYWDERVAAVGADYPEVTRDQFHIDILTANFVLHPDWFDVVVASNLFGDILSDLGPACTGTIGIAPSANINPEGLFPSLFEPVHGSAPDIAGQGIANPIGQIWCGAMMLEHLGYADAGAAVLAAIEDVLARGADAAPFTPDLGGTAATAELGAAIAEVVAG
ncbi:MULTISPECIES: tartrate dehydrogenase [unclassified Microbacterium]|uniref:tartrate dehydrogenase n=1 Tax=unclassified Microbacterium TaxID=2609290 RepID=UPI000CFC7103|nr:MULTISPECIES: tartrate dehydrogenase [unclassified Microbacterium]PQZ51122.1 tartrate dehydrogenase [Microbacterium sp. MYb43]PQZ73464.1 tartrate dehydrogenase [Microbacterium sp. MYb40]PRB15691.1 tartrate dehydrogenase [Microbacterium sp. MYb54]PRB22111.1 tartrate dehydrogenase [Microbacterium sp. MYb50]PRB60542.1 tartrate dehydrogenase [Microbacterium sp. MYb24]